MPNRKTVLIGSSSFPGHGQGIASYVDELVVVFKKKGWNIYLTSPIIRQEKEYHDADCYDDFTFLESNPNGGALEEVLKLYKSMEGLNIDLVINNDNPYLQSLAPLIDSIFISICHMNRTSVMSLSYYNEDFIDYIVAISSDMRMELQSRVKKINHNKIRLIYNGISDPELPNYYNGEVINILYCGGSNFNKGIDLIKNLLKKISQFPVEKKIKISFYGKYKQKDIEFFQQFDFVTFVGWVVRDDLIRAMQYNDILLFPSRVEGCPITIIEAMALGLFVVTTQGKGAMRELVGKDGLALPISKWADETYNVIKSLDRRTLNTLKARSRERYLSKYTSNCLFNSICELNEHLGTVCDNKNFKILKWHRRIAKGNKSSFVDRFLLKIGYLKKARFF